MRNGRDRATSFCMDSKIIDLEVKIAYQDELLETLNVVVTKQQDEIHRLESRLTKLERVIASQSDTGIKDISLETPPPHY